MTVFGAICRFFGNKGKLVDNMRRKVRFFVQRHDRIGTEMLNNSTADTLLTVDLGRHNLVSAVFINVIESDIIRIKALGNRESHDNLIGGLYLLIIGKCGDFKSHGIVCNIGQCFVHKIQNFISAAPKIIFVYLVDLQYGSIFKGAFFYVKRYVTVRINRLLYTQASLVASQILRFYHYIAFGIGHYKCFAKNEITDITVLRRKVG